ncbi:MAG: DpnD/PcfM family protein [Desulfobulbaceae bacterium]|jgi:hypothetical protein|nr:DpnD/PcfM family protein [Desulfobulbaceae bacterium]
MQYKIEITETLQRIIEIDANSESEAVEAVRKSYRNCEIVLDSSDYIATNYDLFRSRVAR